jgi:hypothetical protein
MQIPNRLVELILDRKVVPFIGSGFSIPSGLPSWRHLVAGLMENCASDAQQKGLHDIMSDLDQADVAEILDMFSPTDFAVKEYLSDHINSERFEPSEYHNLLLNLGCDTIITTNWDVLIEQELAKHHIAYRVIYRDSDVAQYDPDRSVQVIKIHGTILDADSLIYKRSQYSTFWNERPLLLNLVCTLMATRSFLFLGYGLGDPNILALLDALRERLGTLRREHYALSFDRGAVFLGLRRQGIHTIDGSDTSTKIDYYGVTKQFLGNITGSPHLVPLTNLERSRLINEELLRIIRRMPPKPVLRMRGALGWLSNPAPVPGDPVYGTEAQDIEERRMTELLCQYLDANAAARVRCILHLDAEPLLRSGYLPRHLVRRFSMIRELMFKYPEQIEIAHDSTPSYLNQMLFDDEAALLGFKRSKVLGIHRALLRRGKAVVRAEVQQFDQDFLDISNSNRGAANAMGVDTGGSAWRLTFVSRLLTDQIDDLASRAAVTEAGVTTLRLNDDVALFADALEFALRKHTEYGQTREDGVTPYGIHIIRVIERLRQVGLIDDFEVLAAAALHDVVEDCEVSLDEIRTRYGERVGVVVGEVTRGADQDRKEYIAQLAGASREGRTIKLADRWDNVLDLRMFKKALFGNRPALEYLDEARMVLAVCKAANVRLSEALEGSIRDTASELTIT